MLFKQTLVNFNRVILNGVRAVFHRPHPQKETDKGAVVSMRRFLKEAGIKC